MLHWIQEILFSPALAEMLCDGVGVVGILILAVSAIYGGAMKYVEGLI